MRSLILLTPCRETRMRVPTPSPQGPFRSCTVSRCEWGAIKNFYLYTSPENVLFPFQFFRPSPCKFIAGEKIARRRRRGSTSRFPEGLFRYSRSPGRIFANARIIHRELLRPFSAHVDRCPRTHPSALFIRESREVPPFSLPPRTRSTLARDR